MAYPCYAWCRRAYAAGFNLGKTPMPSRDLLLVRRRRRRARRARDSRAFLPAQPADARQRLARRRHPHPLRAPQRTGCRGGRPRRAAPSSRRRARRRRRCGRRCGRRARRRRARSRSAGCGSPTDRCKGGETSGRPRARRRQAGAAVLARQLVHRLRGDAEAASVGDLNHDRPRARALLPRRGAAEARVSKGAPVLGGGHLLQRHPRRLPAVRAARRDRECERDGLVCAAVAPRVGEPGAARGAAVDPRQVPLRPPAVQRERPQAVAVR